MARSTPMTGEFVERWPRPLTRATEQASSALSATYRAAAREGAGNLHNHVPEFGIYRADRSIGHREKGS
jgi:hypothetical protein